MGHCLWTGIVDEDKAAPVAEHLLSPEMFTGWGVRTLATDDGRLQPDELPQRLGLAARQRARRGRADALRLRASRRSGSPSACSTRPRSSAGGCPSCSAGSTATSSPSPVPYPTSCSPQAWAAASPLLLLRTLLGFDPDVPEGEVLIAPRLPDRMCPLEIGAIAVAGERAAIRVDGGAVEVRGLSGRLSVRLGG